MKEMINTFSAREKRIIKAAEAVITALERCLRWSGTGSVRQAQALAARESAVVNWNKILNQLSKEN